MENTEHHELATVDEAPVVAKPVAELAPPPSDQNTSEVVRVYLAEMRSKEWLEFKVSNDTNVKKTANAICWHIRQRAKIYLSAIGAGAVNQALKSATIAGSKLRAEGYSLSIIPGFFRAEETVDLTEEPLEEKVNDGKTVMRLFLKVELGA